MHWISKKNSHHPLLRIRGWLELIASIQYTVSNVSHEVCDAIKWHPNSQLIMPPGNTKDIYRKTSECQLKFGTSQAIVCIDGMLISLKMPT